MAAPSVLETRRLTIRRLALDDAGFILELVNEPSWLRFIGDKGVRTLEDARGYIANGPMASYERFGFGLYLVALKDGEPIGICGLLKRDTLPDVDVGFAFVPRAWGSGYALESAAAVLELGFRSFRLKRIVAITAPDNERSIRVLEKLGMEFHETIKLSSDAPALSLYALEAERQEGPT